MLEVLILSLMITHQTNFNTNTRSKSNYVLHKSAAPCYGISIALEETISVDYKVLYSSQANAFRRIYSLIHMTV